MVSRLGRWRTSYSGIACPRCSRPLRHETLLSGSQSCPVCNGLFEAVRFDPVEVKVVVPEIAGTGPEGAAPCARHARNQAEAACARCGQFMCSLCKIDADGKVYCPGCFERLSSEGSLASAVTRVKNYAGWAGLCLVLSIFPFMILSPVTIPLGIYCCIRGIKDKKARQESDGIGRLYFLIVVLLLMAGLGMFAVAGIFMSISRAG